MEKHKCKLCEMRFGSGRALGGHMRSHFTILPVPTKTHLIQQQSEFETSSSSTSELKIGRKKRRKRSSTESDQLEISSASEETSSEEDHLAMCLMLLSRDKWVTTEQKQQEQANPVVKIHECQVCYKVFKSGQALGGHKRSHLLLTSTAAVHSTTSAAAANDEVWLIDLNLPAPFEEAEDINQNPNSSLALMN